MDEDDDRRFQLEVSRLNGAIEELRYRLHQMDAALAHTMQRLFMVVIISAVGFAALFGCKETADLIRRALAGEFAAAAE